MDLTRDKFERVIKLAGNGQPGKRWLDLGCHNAIFARMLADRGLHVTGVDVYDPSLKTEDTWTYVCHNLNEFPLPFTDSSFDVVSAIEVLEHIIDTDRFLDELHRIVRPNGVVLITTPNINMLRNRLRVPFGLYPYGLEYRNEIHHVRLYNATTLRSHLVEHGFVISTLAGLNLLPITLHRFNLLARLSTRAASLLPSLCSDLLVRATPSAAAGSQ